MKRVSLTRKLSAVAGATAIAALVASLQPAAAQTGKLELIEDGKLIVAFNGDMPGTSWENDRLIGLDGELMHSIADQLGLKVEPALMEWAAEIASVKARRVDVMHGMMGWNDQRIKVINITDPIYYGGANITQKKSTNWSTVKELEGRTIATIQGFGWIDQLKRIEGATLKLYDTSDAAIRDLLAGRIEALFADPPLIQYAISKNPDWDIQRSGRPAATSRRRKSMAWATSPGSIRARSTCAPVSTARRTGSSRGWPPTAKRPSPRPGARRAAAPPPCTPASGRPGEAGVRVAAAGRGPVQELWQPGGAEGHQHHA
jgi:ABC-type amino acid transport substrate-binding protein